MKNYALPIYQLFAIIAGIGWIISILANFVNGETVFDFLRYMSAEQFEYDPMLDYWMKMTGLAFAFIGLGFLYCGIKWKEGFPYGIYFGVYQLVSALSVLLTMARLELDSQMYLLDCVFFLGTGIPMTLAWFGVRNDLRGHNAGQD